MRLFDAGLREDRPVVVHDTVWTAANAVTLLRLAGLPLFVWLMVGPEAYGTAFLTLTLIAATDWVDGYIARRFDQVSRLGRLLDPLIDRLLLATVGLTLAALGILPWTVVALVVGRDVLVIGAALVLFRGVPDIPVNRLGKLATALLLIGVPCYLLGHVDWAGAAVAATAAPLVTAAGIVTYYAAGVAYARTARDRLGRTAAPADPPNQARSAGE